MKFALLIYGAEAQWDALDEAGQAAVIGEHGAYTQALTAAKALIAGEPLAPSATARRVTDTGVVDGPYADTKEQLGGFYVIEVADEAAALDWAARCPRLPGDQIEVRQAPDFADAG